MATDGTQAAPPYRITQKGKTVNIGVDDFESLETHHPGSNRDAHLVNGVVVDGEDGRNHAVIGGEIEEVEYATPSRDYGLTANQVLIKKDFILEDSRIAAGQLGVRAVDVPAPIGGYVGRTNDAQGLVDIYDRKGGEVIARIRHMNPILVKEGETIEFGQALGTQNNAGLPATAGKHVHLEMDSRYVQQYENYISDITSGRLSIDNERRTGGIDARPVVDDGVLRLGESGEQVEAVQRVLIAEGLKGADGQALEPNGVYSVNMQPAVLAFQKTHGLPETGDIDAATIQATLGHQSTQTDEAIGSTPTNPPMAGTAPPVQSPDAMSDGVLKQEDRGEPVRELQQHLIDLGYTDAQGKPLRADGVFGQKTKEAVEAFQQDNDGLTADGIVGSKTLEALKTATAKDPAQDTSTPTQLPIQPTQPAKEGTASAQTNTGPLLSDPSHPDHGLYKQALAGIEKLGPQAFKDQAECERAAATLTYEAKVSGMSKIDHVVPNASGTGLFAVQGALNDPAHQRVYADKAQAAQQPVDKTTEQLSQDVPRQTNAPAVQANQDQVKTMNV